MFLVEVKHKINKFICLFFNMKYFNLFLILILLVFFSSCSTDKKIEIDPKCEQRAKELVPKEVVLKFEKAHLGINDLELPYVLNSVNWNDGKSSITNRAFRIPTTTGLDRSLYYSLQKGTEMKDSWDHTDEIIYESSFGENYAKYHYDFVLRATNDFTYDVKENLLTGIPQEDNTKGSRVFEVVKSEVVFCEDDY